MTWRVWAAGHHLEYPGYGLTSLLDAPGTAWPATASETVAGLDAGELLRAGMVAATVLDEAAYLVSGVVTDPPEGLRRWVRGRLAQQPAELTGEGRLRQG